MPKLPIVSGRWLVRFFEQRGFKRKSQKGSHITLAKKAVGRRLVIPDHKEVSLDVLTSNLKTAGISRDELIAAAQKKKRGK